jgi:hypothetical protein
MTPFDSDVPKPQLNQFTVNVPEGEEMKAVMRVLFTPTLLSFG